MQLISDSGRLLLKSYSIGGLLLLPGPFSGKISVLLLKYGFRVLLPPPAVVVCVHAHTRVCQRVCVCHWVYTSINRQEDEDFGKHFYLFFYTWIAVGPRRIETKCVRPTSDGTRPSPHRCDFTLERNRSLVQAQVNLNKALHTSVWCDTDEVSDCLTTLFKFTRA